MIRVVAACSLLLFGCAEEPGQSLCVFAASSLAGALGELEHELEREHPGTDVQTSFAGSHLLRLQIEQGAPADVFVSADEGHMDALARAGLATDIAVLAHSELVVIVPLDNPAGITSLGELPRASRIVLGEPSVPVGRYARALLRDAADRLGPRFEADVLAHVVSQESNARLVRTKVELGEADAAIVYRTDAIASDRVRIVSIPPELSVRADYFVARVAGSAPETLAREWIELARGPRGQRVLAAHGFTVAP